MKIKRLTPDGFETVFESSIISLEFNGISYDITLTIDDTLCIRKYGAKDNTIDIRCKWSNAIEIK